MNTGAEGVETAIKLAKKWGYKVKGVPKGKAIIISVDECFHGRTHAAISLSNDPSARDGFEPLLPNVLKTSFNDASTLEAVCIFIHTQSFFIIITCLPIIHMMMWIIIIMSDD